MTEKARVLFNPVAGSGGAGRWLPGVLATLRPRFAEVIAEQTEGPDTAGKQAARAVQQGATHVLVCGGDGTLAEALQGMVGTGAALGILPLGTGNVVAADLGLSTDPVVAAGQLLEASVEAVPVGVAEFSGRRRYFLASAGAGLHAELMGVPKVAGLGRVQYYAHGMRLLATRSRTKFAARLHMAGGAMQELAVEEVLVSRVESYGGALRRWKPGMTLRDSGLVVTLAESSSLFTTAEFLARAVAGWETSPVSGFRTLAVESVECEGGDVAVQIDGTLAGTLPVRFASVDAAVRLLVPRLVTS